MALNEGQVVTLAIDEIIETVSSITPMAQKAKKYTPPAATMQRSSNTIWMPVEQEAPSQEGWDLTGKATGITELNVAVNLGEPDNDFFSLRADDLRDETSYRHRIQASARKLANNVELKIANLAASMGSLVVTDSQAINADPARGWDMLAHAESLMFSRELNRDAGLSWFFNPDDYRRAGYNLAGKDLYGNIPEDAYKNGSVQRQVAGFDDVMRSPKLPVLPKSTATGITVSGAQSFAPVAWKLDNDGNKVNVDNRFATVTVSSTTGLKRGDKISFAGVKFLGQMAKNVLAEDATFAVVNVIDGTHVEITPKPVALNDTTLSPEQRAYANVNTTLAANTAINILNIADAKTNVFWADDAIRIVSQPIPTNSDLFAGMKTTSFSIDDVGLNGIFAFQGDINTLSGLCRVALWYGVNATRPEAIGVGLPSQA